MTTFDCYKTLRIKPNASSAEIEKAADRMTSIWCPDDYDDFKEVALCAIDDIVTAKRILLDPSTRKKHDYERNERMSKFYDTEGCSEVEIRSVSGQSGKYHRPWAGSFYLTETPSTEKTDVTKFNVTGFENEETSGSLTFEVPSKGIYEDTGSMESSTASSTIVPMDSENAGVDSSKIGKDTQEKSLNENLSSSKTDDENDGRMELIEGTLSPEISSSDDDASKNDSELTLITTTKSFIYKEEEKEVAVKNQEPVEDQFVSQPFPKSLSWWKSNPENVYQKNNNGESDNIISSTNQQLPKVDANTIQVTRRSSIKLYQSNQFSTGEFGKINKKKSNLDKIEEESHKYAIDNSTIQKPNPNENLDCIGIEMPLSFTNSSMPLSEEAKTPHDLINKLQMCRSDSIMYSRFLQNASKMEDCNPRRYSDSALREVSQRWSMNLSTETLNINLKDKKEIKDCENSEAITSQEHLEYNKDIDKIVEGQRSDKSVSMDTQMKTFFRKNDEVSPITGSACDDLNDANYYSNEIEEYKYENKLTNTSISYHSKSKECTKNVSLKENLEKNFGGIEHSLNLSSLKFRKCISDSMVSSNSIRNGSCVENITPKRHSESAFTDILAGSRLSIFSVDEPIIYNQGNTLFESEQNSNLNSFEKSLGEFSLSVGTEKSTNNQNLIVPNEKQISKYSDDSKESNNIDNAASTRRIREEYLERTPTSKKVKIIVDVTIISNKTPSSSYSKNTTTTGDISELLNETSSMNLPISIGVSKSKTIAIADGNYMSCVSVLKSEQDQLDLNDIDIFNWNARANASYSLKAEGGKVVFTSTDLENFSVNTKYHFGNNGEDIIEIFAEGKLKCKIVNGLAKNFDVGNSTQKKEKKTPFLMASIIRVDNIQIVTTRVIGESSDTIKVYKNGELLCNFDNTSQTNDSGNGSNN